MRSSIFIGLLLVSSCRPCFAGNTVDIIPNVADKNSAMTTTILNNNMRQQQATLDQLGGYFTSSGILAASAGGTGVNLSSNGNNDLLIWDSGNIGIGTLNPGTNGQFLQSQGAGSKPAFATVTVPTNYVTLVSNTAVSSVSNTGDIAIDAAKYYMVVANFATMSGNDTYYLRFNNDSGLTNYKYVYRSFDVNAAASNGNSSAGNSQIQMAPQATSGGNQAIFYILPQNSSLFVKGSMFGAFAVGATYLYSDFFGQWNNATVTSFRILTASGATFSGNVLLYEMVQA